LKRKVLLSQNIYEYRRRDFLYERLRSLGTFKKYHLLNIHHSHDFSWVREVLLKIVKRSISSERFFLCESLLSIGAL
jgi:hypothetical protein